MGKNRERQRGQTEEQELAHVHPQQNTPATITTRVAAEMWDIRTPASVRFDAAAGACRRSAHALNTGCSRGCDDHLAVVRTASSYLPEPIPVSAKMPWSAIHLKVCS